MMLISTTKDEEPTSSRSMPTPEQPCRLFSVAEIKSATQNFDEELCIGRGGFGNVYRGAIKDGPIKTCAIKRLHSLSDQGENEFWAEVQMLSRLRHCNLVSLIGYCNDGKEMALVYEYMTHGALSDHLHKEGTPLTWSQRLKICIGAAKGLDYLHTGTSTQHGIIHRDVKSSNILLGNNYAAKISDFGLAKVGRTNQTCTHVSSTILKGTFGYIDPNYYNTGRLTRKSDVYAFGVVLLEVLCGRPAVDPSLEEGLATWARDRIKQGKLARIIDSSLKENISTKSSKEFSRIACRCLHSDPNERPMMSEIICSLELALSIQKTKDSSGRRRIVTKKAWPFYSSKTQLPSKNKKLSDIEVLTKVEADQRGALEGQNANDGPLPALENLQILGDAVPGRKLLMTKKESVYIGTFLVCFLFTYLSLGQKLLMTKEEGVYVGVVVFLVCLLITPLSPARRLLMTKEEGVGVFLVCFLITYLS